MPAETQDHHASETLILEGCEALKSLGVSAGKARVGAYAIRFSTPDEKDLSGEYFTAKTDFGARCGDGATTMFHHGMPIASGLKAIAERTFGPVTTRRDETGIFAETVLDLSDEYEAAIADLCAKGKLKWSSGSSAHLVRKAVDGQILRWHPIEFSFTPTPVEPRLPAIRPIKSLEAASGAMAQELEALISQHVDTRKQATKAAPGADAKSISQSARITMPEKTPEELAAERKAEIDSAVKARELAISEINDLGAQYHCMDAAKSYIRDGKSPEDFRKYILTDVLKARPVNPNAGLIGMDEKEISRFSMLKAIRDYAVHGKLEGLEREVHEAAVKATKRSDLKGLTLIVPDDVLRASTHLKSQSISVATAGGFTMQPQLGPMIELLRNKMILTQAGCTQMGGLVGDVYLPQHVSGATAYWVSETGALTDSQSVFAQKKLTPHRIGATIPYSTQFLAQSSIDAESFIRNDATTQIALEKDRAGLHGTGANGQPLGVIATNGINQTVTYGGAATWEDVVEHETGIAADNADIGTMAFLLSPTAVGKWKTILRSNVAGARYLIDDDMTANGYSVFRSNQVSNNGASNYSFFGVWSQFIQASWSGLEVIVDPYALKKSGQVEVTFNELVDQLVRQPKAFNVSTDSAAQ